MRTAVLLAVAVGLAPALAGCLFGAGSCATVRGAWQQDGLFERVDPAASPEGWSLTLKDPDGLDFQNGTLDERWGPDRYALVGVGWESGVAVEGRGGNVGMGLAPPAEVTSRARGDVPEEALAEAFQRFAANLTDADEETLEGWTDAFLDSKRPAGSMTRGSDGARFAFYAYSVNLTGELAVSEHYRRLAPPTPEISLEGMDADERRGVEIGQATTAAGSWIFRFRFPTVAAENLDRGDEGVNRIEVDAFDRVGVHVALDGTDRAAERSVPMVEAAFGELGWPPPELSPEHVRLAAVC